MLFPASPRRRKDDRPLTVKEASRAFHDDADKALIRVYNTLAAHGHDNLTFPAIVILYCIHLSSEDLTRQDISLKTGVPESKVENHLKKLKLRELVENGSSIQGMAYYRTTANGIRILNLGLNRSNL